jgi:hypothetical protein
MFITLIVVTGLFWGVLQVGVTLIRDLKRCDILNKNYYKAKMTLNVGKIIGYNIIQPFNASQIMY